MFTIWVILCQCGIFKICKKKKKRLRFRCYVFQYHVFSSLLFFLEKWSTLQASPSSFYVFFFRLHYKPTSRCPGNEPASPTKKTLLGAKQDPTEGATKIKPIFCYTVHFYTLRLIFPREAKEKESARGTMGRRKVIASSYWDTQQEPALRRENHPCQGHPTAIFGKISVRKTICDLEFSEHLL